MIVPTRRLRRTLLAAAVSGGLMLAGAPLASAAPAIAPVAVPSVASPGTGIPVLGGLIDSVVGILTGTTYGIAGAAGAVVCSVAPACVPVKATS